MSSERSASIERNTELIVTHLTEYLSIRFDQAARINSNLGPIKHDLIFHELSNVRRALYGSKIYGPTRACVVDVILGDNEKRRQNLMSKTDQTSIQVELVSHVQDHRVEATRGQIKIHDLKTFYAAINPTLSDFMDLFETWIWWDILDSAELVRFEQKMGKIQFIRQGKMTPEMRKRYATLLNPAEAEDADAPPNNKEKKEPGSSKISDEDVLKYELQQMSEIVRHWKYRRNNDLGYQYVLKRDEMPLPSEGEMIHKITDKVREYDTIEHVEDVDEDIQHRYAPTLRVAPQKVTRELVLDFIKRELVELEREMLMKTDAEERLGPPYNFKERQGEQMSRLLADLQRQLGIDVVSRTPTLNTAEAAAPPS